MNANADFFPKYSYLNLLSQEYTNESPYPRFTGFQGLSTSNPVYANGLHTAIERLRDHFNKEGPDIAPMNCLILGPPGAGKTFLAKQLTKSLSGVKFEEHNLSLTDDPKYLEEKVFGEREAKKLVFIDEFDVSISGSSVVRFILDPLTKARDLPIAYVFSGSYLKNIQVLRSLGKSFSDIDFSQFLFDVYLQEQNDGLKSRIAELHGIAIQYWENRHRATPDHDVLSYLRGLDKLQDFLSRINGFIVQIPDLSSPMAITESWLSLESNKIEAAGDPCPSSTNKRVMKLANRGVSSENVFEFVRALEAPAHLYWREFADPCEPARDYKHMLLTERYGLVNIFLSAKFGGKKGKVFSISRQLLNYLVMVPLLHNVRSLRFLIDNCLVENVCAQNESSAELEFDIPQNDLFNMHVDSRYLFRNPESLWRFLVSRNPGSSFEQEDGKKLIQIASSNKGLVSIIVTNHKYEEFIREALESIAQQDYELIELIVAHDVPEDRAGDDGQSICSMIDDFEEGHPRRFWRKIELIKDLEDKKRGKLGILNKAIPRVHGEYVMILDADDTLEKNYVSQVVGELEKQRKKNDKIGFVYTNCILFGDRVTTPCTGEAELFDKGTFINHGLNYIPEPAIMLTTALQCVIPFDENINLPDRSTKRHKYTRLLNNGWQGFWLEKPLFRYRMHGENESGISSDVEIVSRYYNKIPLARLKQATSGNKNINERCTEVKKLFSGCIGEGNLNNMVSEFSIMWEAAGAK